MKNFLLIILLSIFTINAYCQNRLQDTSVLKKYNLERIAITQKGMYTLGAWSVANIGIGAIGWSRGANNSNKYFHQMNVFWNVVNLAIATPGIISVYKAKKKNYTVEQTLREQRKIKTTYLVNFGLDFAYIGAGIGLMEHARKNPESNKYNRNKGFGESLILQGGFLMLYDAIMYTAHLHHEQKK
jgi:hypothetical protein